MFKDPDEIAAEEAAAKLDRAAAARRSTIRRETTVRPSRTTRSAHERRADFLRRAHARLHQDEVEADREIASLETQLEVLRRERLRQREMLGGNGENTAVRDGAQSRTENVRLRGPSTFDPLDSLDVARRAHEEEETTTEPTSEVSETIRQHLPRPPRESNLRFEVSVSSHAGSISPRRYPASHRSAIPSPPLSSGSNDRGRIPPDGPIFPDGPIDDTLTPNFAPARGPYHDTLQPSDTLNRRTISSGRDDENLALGTPPPEDLWEAPYPPLRRINHRSPRPSRGLRNSTRDDGLGDRRRSPSPFSDTQEEETWSNLLSTMNNHTSQPSNLSTTSTSFASRSDSRSQPTTTTTSFGEIGLPDSEVCDLDLAPGITEDDVRQIRERHRRTAGRVRDPSPPVHGERARREHDARMRARMSELNMIQEMLERGFRGEAGHGDVPGELWAAIGLSPDMGGGA